MLGGEHDQRAAIQLARRQRERDERDGEDHERFAVITIRPSETRCWENGHNGAIPLA
ncbi:MAG: hypothetical protein QOD83_2341 [Solirubrobacteraceae bacterium]|nr:hypothetical protein [Solirubrobacteraceae bacterium]